MPIPCVRRASTSVTITDPLVKYQSMLATGLCSPDPAQHRLALHLHKIYARLKDYSPSTEYRARLDAIRRELADSDAAHHAAAAPPDAVLGSPALAARNHPIWRNPLLARFFARIAESAGAKAPALADHGALTRVLTSHEEALRIDSPRGLFLSGEVGTGKSMLLDLLAEGLPTGRKRRWHFNTFMLHTLSRLEQHRKSQRQHPSAAGPGAQEYSILWMAKDMVESSPILFLDEFQLPDRAASKILSNLFTAFFQLGGVLVASSNRMPDELERATGFDYAPPPPRGGLLGSGLALLSGRAAAARRGRGELFGSTSDFANFLEVLKARCEFWHMDGAKDWRRRDVDQESSSRVQISGAPAGATATNATVRASEESLGSIREAGMAITPKHFFIIGEQDDQAWEAAVAGLEPHGAAAEPASISPRTADWQPLQLTVYGRQVTVPRHRGGVAYWSFEELIGGTFGPADYISMASAAHTLVLDGVPLLTALRRNEARRLITLLDALYEAHCRLLLRAAAGPDDLFFPESAQATKRRNAGSAAAGNTEPGQQDQNPLPINEDPDADAMHSETYAEAYQDAASPFRPNISSYRESGETAAYDPDHDFAEAAPNPIASAQQEQRRRMKGAGSSSAIDFANTSAFTGEDERFAHRRAASRLWELCGAAWWRARDPARASDWWRPLPSDARHWERGGGGGGDGAEEGSSRSAQGKDANELLRRKNSAGGERIGPAVVLDQPAGLGGRDVEFLRKSGAADEHGEGGGQDGLDEGAESASRRP